MENQKEEELLFDTASSDFYSKKNDNFIKSAVSTPKNSYGDRYLVEGLQSQISRIREVLTANNMRLDRLECKEELRTYVKETNQQLHILHSKCQGENAIIKDQFQKNMSSLDREVTSLKREWKNYKEKQEEVLTESLQDLRINKKQTQSLLGNLLKDTTNEVKCKFAMFGKQVREFKKNRSDKKSNLMQELDILRNTINQKIECERKKRTQYEEIVLVLLDKTCEQGEKILRRIC